jgi:hypothetical protein
LDSKKPFIFNMFHHFMIIDWRGVFGDNS